MIDSLRLLIPRIRQDTLRPGSLRARFARGVAWSFIGAALGQGLSMLANIAAARLLGKTSYGEFGIIVSTIAAFGVFAGIGLGMAATKYVAELRTQDPVRAGQVLGLSLATSVLLGGAMSALLLGLAPWLARTTLNAPHLAGELRLGCALLVLNVIGGVQTSALAGLEAFRTVAGVNVVRGAFTLPCVLLGTRWFGLSGAVGAMIVAAVAACVVGGRALRMECRAFDIRITLRGCWRGARSILWEFSFPALATTVLVSPTAWWTNTLLVRQRDGYAQMGLLNGVIQWRLALLSLFLMFAGANLAILSNLFGQRDKQGFFKVVNGSMLLTLVVSGAISVPVIVLSSWLMGLYGRGFAGAGAMLQLTAVTSLIVALATVVGQAIASMGAIWLGFLLNLVWAGVTIGLAYMLVDRGAMGLVITYLASYALLGAQSWLYLIHARRAKIWSRP